jgi:hypothetical protein
MSQMTLHLTRSSHLWTFQLLGFEAFQVRLQKKKHFNRIYRGANFNRLKIKTLTTFSLFEINLNCLYYSN